MRQRKFTLSIDGKERASITIKIRLTREEVRHVQQIAKRLKRSVSTYLTDVAG